MYFTESAPSWVLVLLRGGRCEGPENGHGVYTVKLLKPSIGCKPEFFAELTGSEAARLRSRLWDVHQLLACGFPSTSTVRDMLSGAENVAFGIPAGVHHASS